MRRRSTDTQGAYLLRWSRWDAYQRAGDGWIYPASLGREKYDPTQQPALPTELARVAHPYRRARAIQQFTEASMSKDNDSGDCDTILVSTGSMNYKWTAIVRFLTQFGHLGQTELQEPLEVRRFKREGNVFYPAGDHIGWFLEHAQHVRTCLALIAALNASKFSDERERGRRVLRHIEEPRPERVGWPWLTPTLEKSYQPVFPRMLYEPDDLVG